jgi:hypothetical protein
VHVRGQVPHSGLRRDFRWLSHRKSVTLSVETPLCPYGIAYRRGCGLSTTGLFKKPLCNPLCDHLAFVEGGSRLILVLPHVTPCRVYHQHRVFRLVWVLGLGGLEFRVWVLGLRVQPSSPSDKHVKPHRFGRYSAVPQRHTNPHLFRWSRPKETPIREVASWVTGRKPHP